MPEERARPSLMGPAAGPLLAMIVSSCDKVGRREDLDAMVAALEKGFQDEMDEQLRILNEKGIKDKEMRSLIIKGRDESYDALAAQGLDETLLEKQVKSPIYQSTLYATMAVMRLSRQV